MKLLASLLLLAVCLSVYPSATAYKKTHVQTYRTYNYYPKYPYHHGYHHYRYHYKKSKRIRWPKIRGRCAVSPAWNINGSNPVNEAAAKGNTVVLFLMKRTCKFCFEQLRSLGRLAQQYRLAGKKVSFVALNHRNYPVSNMVKKAYLPVDIYQEPKNTTIFKSIRGKWRQILVYDKCGRQQYHFGYPYSWTGYPFVQSAISNTLQFHETLCGKCGPGQTGGATTPMPNPSL